MCGIAGAASAGAVLGPAEVRAVERMLGALRHRGPDRVAVESDARAVLGCARLRVLDLSPAADLPMSAEGGRVLLTYNGEITNFAEERERLVRERGTRFRTGSDSEVLLALYAESGIDCLRRLTGQFAFFLQDRARGKAWLVRDFYGLRPLFYREAAGRLWFASELKAFLELPDFAPAVDEDSLDHFLSLAYVPGRATAFRGASELRPGELLEIDLERGSWERRRYYRLAPAVHEGDPEAAARRVRELLRDSVRRNLRADAPVGLTLSGGIDTSSLLALAHELGHGDSLRTFSISMGDPGFDESRWQAAALAAYPSPHHTVRVGPEDVGAALLAQAAHLDEPTGDGAAVPLFLLGREAAGRVRVLLSGEGGDEIFGAYETYRAYRLRESYRRWVPGPLRAALRALARSLPVSHGKLSLDFVAKRFTEGAEMPVPEAHLHWRHAFTEEEKALLLRRRAPRPTAELFREGLESCASADELNRLGELDLELYFTDDLMVKNDRMLAAHSLETRFPYMDRELVEFAFSIPAALKTGPLEGRKLQRRAMWDLLPPAIRARPNMGLELPYSSWLLGPLRPLAERYLEPRRVAATGALDPAGVSLFWDRHQRRVQDHGRGLWCLLNFMVWHELFIEGRGYKSHLNVPA